MYLPSHSSGTYLQRKKNILKRDISGYHSRECENENPLEYVAVQSAS